MGLVADVFTEARLKRLKGRSRSATCDTPPRAARSSRMPSRSSRRVATAWSRWRTTGTWFNAQIVRAELEAHGSIFSSSTDSEVIVHLVARSKSDDLVEATAEALSRLSGAYSLVLMNERELLGIRDPHGLRPLSLGKLGDAWVLASESCAFDLIDATFVRDLEPGSSCTSRRTG